MTRDFDDIYQSWELKERAWYDYWEKREMQGFTRIGPHENPKANLLDLIRCQAPRVWARITGRR